MRTSTKVLIVAAAVSAAGIGIAAYVSLRPVELPEPSAGNHAEVFPELDFDAAAPGTSVDRIYRAFGKRPSQLGTTGGARRCIYFMYDPQLSEGTLAVLANATTIEQRWLVKGSATPKECHGLPEERVDLRGWYAAEAR